MTWKDWFWLAVVWGVGVFTGRATKGMWSGDDD